MATFKSMMGKKSSSKPTSKAKVCKECGSKMTGKVCKNC